MVVWLVTMVPDAIIALYGDDFTWWYLILKDYPACNTTGIVYLIFMLSILRHWTRSSSYG